MEVGGYGTIKIELYPDMAPNTVKNFIRLAQRDFYNGKTFTNIEEDLIKGGSVETVKSAEGAEENAESTARPKLSDIKDLAEGEEDKAYSIKGEFIEAGYNDNTLSHQRGIITMDRKNSNQYYSEISMMKMMGEQYENYLETILDEMYNSQTSGFCILTQDKPEYNGQYTAFGKVIEGMDVVDNISKIEVQKQLSDSGEESNSSKPVKEPVISKVTVDTFGVDYGDPETESLFDFDAIFEMFMQNFMQSQSTGTTAE